jgi:hypothetical protein
MEFVYHKLLIACIGKFEYMFDLIFLPDCSEIVGKLVKTYRGLGIGKRCNEEQKK